MATAKKNLSYVTKEELKILEMFRGASPSTRDMMITAARAISTALDPAIIVKRKLRLVASNETLASTASVVTAPRLTLV